MFAGRTAWQLATNRFTVALEQAPNAGLPLLDLTVSNPTAAGIRYDADAVLEALRDPRALDYHPDPRGLHVARDAVASYYAERGAPVALDDIFLTTSTSEAYSYVFRLLCDPGDEIVIASPSYPLFEFLAGICDVRLRSFELVYDHGWLIDFHSLERALSPRTRALMLVHPNNPTGSFVKPHERERIERLCAERGIAIVADEVFLDYPHDGHARASFVSASEALTFTLSGVSKISGLPQMKLAWLVLAGPEPLRREAGARLEVIADTFLSMNAPVQWAAPEFLQQRHAVQRQLMDRVRANLATLDRLLARSDCRRLDVEGGWYATVRVPRTRSDEDLAVELIERSGVVVHPGHFFDFHEEGFVVLSLITPEADFSSGAERLLRFQF